VKQHFEKEQIGGIAKEVRTQLVIVAVAHRILKAIYRIIKEGARFRDLREKYLTLRSKSKKV
jgi:hypothetical protein